MKARENLYLVQDGDVPLYVIAPSYGEAVQRWEAQVRSDDDSADGGEIEPPHGVQLVAKASELLLPPWDPAVAAPVPDPVDPIDYDAVREIAETADADLDSMEYLTPFEVRDICRELLRLRQIHGGAA